MSVNRHTLILLLTAEADSPITSLIEQSFEAYIFSNVKDALKTMQNILYDLIILDDLLFGDKLSEVIQELKRRFPTIPLVVLSNNKAADYQEELFRAGADDVLNKQSSEDELHYHVRFMLKQQRQSRALLQLNRNLHAMASLTRMLYSAPDTYTLILQAFNLIRNAFQLYGLAIVLQEGEEFRMYAGGEDATHRNRLYEGVVPQNANDPFLWTFHNRTTQIYQDIKANPHYTPVPVLSQPEAAAIIPLTNQRNILGVMGIFARPGSGLSAEDLILYEQFGAQLSSALLNVHQYQTQSANIQSSMHLLQAWQTFMKLQSAQEIAEALCGLVEGAPSVERAFVWLDNIGESPIVSSCSGSTLSVKAFTQLRELGLLRELDGAFDDKLQVVQLHLREVQKTPFATLFEALQVRQLILLPIVSPKRFMGGIIAGVAGDTDFSSEDINLIKNLSYIAGVVLERSILMEAVFQQNQRLEAILHSISEGVFFVDDNNRVAFCNPQVTELTSVSTANVINQDAETLLRGIAAASDAPDRAYAQLRASRAAVTKPDDAVQDYPIVELSMPNLDREINIEFVKIAKHSWAGVIQDNTRKKTIGRSLDVLIGSMLERFRIPYAQAISLITTLLSEHGHFSYRERDLLLNQIETNVERVGHLWNNFVDIYNLEAGNVALNPELTTVEDIVRRVLNSRHLNKAFWRITVDMPSTQLPVRVDEFRIERAIADVIQRALSVSPPSARITLRVRRHQHEVLIAVEDAGGPVSEQQLTRLFELADGAIVVDTADFGVYLARELVRRHAGRIWAENAEKGTMITIALPLADSADSVEAVLEAPEPPQNEETVNGQPARAGNRAPNRTPRTVMLVQGQSTLMDSLREQLQKHHYELLVCHSAQDALRDVRLTHLDLIAIDASLDDGRGLELCINLRQVTETPIILVADKASNAEKVDGLNAGADDYLTRPIAQEELMARVNVIFKRQTISDRTSEPLAVGDLYIDFARREIYLEGKPIELTRIEYDLLHMLILNRGRVLTHRQLLEKVWGPEYQDETHYLWVNISRLRKKLEPRPDSTRYIHTQLGIGYCFEVP